MKQVEHLHQIFINDSDEPGIFSPIVEENRRSFQALYPEASYKCWGKEEGRAFLGKHFEPEVLEAFDLLAPYAYKADLLRYALLYHFGGVYSDLSVRWLHPWTIPEAFGLAAFQDEDADYATWTALSNAVIAADAGRPELSRAIKAIVANCRERYYGANALYPSGPVLFGKAVAAEYAGLFESRKECDQWIGFLRSATQVRSDNNMCYITPDLTVVAFRMKGINAGGDLTRLGLQGTNNYNTYWNFRQVYGELTDRTWRWDDPSLHVTDNGQRTGTGIAAIPGRKGLVSYGPYVDLPAGSYRVEIVFSAEACLPAMKIDITGNCGTEIVKVHEQDAVRASQIALDFQLQAPLEKTEIRVYVDGDLEPEIQALRLTSLEP